MRVKSVFMVLMTLALLPAVASAQDRKVFGEIGIGPTPLFGKASDYIGTGFNFDAGALIKTSDVFGVKIDTMVSRHDVKDEVTTRLGVGDGNVWIWHLSGSAVVSSPMSARASVYGIGGGGVYYRHINLTNPGVGFATVCDPWLFICYDTPVATDKIIGSRSSTDFGMNVGAGLNFKVSEGSALFVEIRYHYIWGPKPSVTVNPLTGASTNNGDVNTQMMPIIFGVRF